MIIQSITLYSGDDLILNWKMLCVSLLSTALLILSFISVRSCLGEWNIPIQMTLLFESLVIWSLMLFIPLMYYGGYKLICFFNPSCINYN